MQQQQQPLDGELSQQNRQLRQLAQQDLPPPTLQSVHAATPHPAEHRWIALVMMMMAKVVAEVAEMMVVMMMMVLLATTYLIMTPLMMIPLEGPTCLTRKHDSYALWKPFGVQP